MLLPLYPRQLTCMANKFFSTVVLGLCAFALQAQLAAIGGNAPVFKNQPVYLYTINDFITGNAVLLDSTTIRTNGSFTLQNPAKQTVYAYVSIGGLQYDFYLAPSAYLEVTIPDTVGFAKDSVLKPLVFGGGMMAEALNIPITKFDAEYNDFILANYKLILRKTGQKAFGDFIKKLKVDYPLSTKSGFIDDYITYRIASLELSANIKSQKTIIKQYFNNKPVLYTNIAYMDLFNQAFEGDLKGFVISTKGQKLLNAINVNADFDKALNLLKQDSTLQNDTVRELYLIKGLGELFYRPGMVKYSILEMLKYAAEKALTPDNKLIATHLLAKLEKLRIGTAAPNFTLKNIVTGLPVSLADFRGKVVYLSFWDENNIPSVQEIDLIKELEKEFGRRIAFISIGNYEDETKTLALINRNKYKWVFLNSKGNKQLVDDYEVLSYPAFYLIDAAGNVLKYPADKPSGTIGATLEKIYNNK